MRTSSATRRARLRSYVVGFVMASVLTAVPFALVAWRILTDGATLTLIAVLAVAQITVHLRYFLHLDLAPSSRPRLVLLALAAVLIAIMGGGTLWIMSDLAARMM